MLAAILATLFQLASTSATDKIIFPCQNGGSYSVLVPAGAAIDGKNCVGSLVLDDSVRIIDDAAFEGSKLTSVVIPNSVVSIGARAFASSTLTSVEMGNSVSKIGNYAFQGLKSKLIVIPDSVLKIGDFSFAYSELESVTIGSSVTDIGQGAFRNSKITSVIIPDSVVNIGTTVNGLANSNGVFMQTPLSSVVLGKSTTTIGTFAFGYTNLKTVQIPDSVVEIGHWAFSNNPSLDSVIFGNSVKIIRKWAFASTSILSITLPNSVKLIEAGAFEGNFNLGRISIPDSIEVLEEDVFARDYALKSIEYCGIPRVFPITSVCPTERQAEIDAKNLAIKLAADKAAAEAQAILGSRKLLVKELETKLTSLMFAKPDLKTLILKIQNSLNSINLSPEVISDSGLNQSLVPIQKQILAIEKMPTITCTKGKLTKKVTAVKPKCPTGYKKK